jgi:type VI secretion system secreted protein VgrG
MATKAFALILPDLVCDLRVDALTGEEGINQTYRFDIRVAGNLDDDFSQRILGTPAQLILNDAGAPGRHIHGIVSSCSVLRRDARGELVLKLRVVPRLARLRKHRTSQIFQEKTTREIVEAVLQRAKIPNRWHVQGTLQRRVYCVQYDETDYQFVTRLCAAEGIFFFFEQDAEEGERVVFGDSPGSYVATAPPPRLEFRPTDRDEAGIVAQPSHVQEFNLRHATRTKRVLLRRFDINRPNLPHHDAVDIEALSGSDLAAVALYAQKDATVYEHGNAREQSLLNPISAKTALETLRADALIASGATMNRELFPGKPFDLVDHSVLSVDGSYVVISCSHDGSLESSRIVYRNRFDAVPAGIAFRAPRPRRRVRQSLETATVVGPVGEEVYTDDMGRVRVQFHWDLAARGDENDSCWLRVVQPWAGAGFGTQFLPRVNHEVLVGYIDGDPDRPIVLGSLHNGLNPTPFSFPRENTQSGIRTTSIPKGTGGHELVFEDRAGSEFVALRSNRAMELSAADHSTLRAEGKLTLGAGGDRQDDVLGDFASRVVGDETRTTNGARAAQVDGDESALIGGNRRTEVAGNEVTVVRGVSLSVLSGPRSTIVGADAAAPSDDTLSVSGQYRAGSGREMVFTSQKLVQITCGKSRIVLHPDRILIESPEIQLQAAKRIALVQGDPPEASLTLEGSASLAGGTAAVVGGGKGGGRLFLDAEAHLDGALVKLNCGPSGGADAHVIHETEQSGTAQFTILPEGAPPGVTSVTLVIATPTGEVVERTCPVGGTVQMTGNPGDVFALVETRIGDQSVAAHKKHNPEGT